MNNSNDNSFSPNFNENNNLDIKRYLSMFVSNWYWFAIALYISVTIAYGINRYSEKVYTVSATLLIKDNQSMGMSGQAESVIPGGDIFKSQQNLTNEIAILKSLSLNYMVMKDLEDFHVVYINVGKRDIAKTRMYKTCPFKVVYDSLEIQPKGWKVSIKVLSEEQYSIEIDGDKDFIKTKRFGDRFNEKGFDFILEKRNPEAPVFLKANSNKYDFWFDDPWSLARQYQGKLLIEPIQEGASIVTLSVSGFVAAQEIDYLNHLMDVYITYGLNFKKQIAEQTITFINEQLKIISVTLEDAANQLERFRLDNSFFDLSSEGALIQSRLERTENEKATFELQLQYYNYLLEYLENKNADGTIISPTVIGITDPILLSRVNELSSLQREREKMRLNLGENQPALELIYKQAEVASEALRENIRNGIVSLSDSKAETGRKISLLDKDINRLPTIEKTLITIQRQFDLNNTVYTYLLEKRAESGIAMASTLPDNRPIDHAQSGGTVLPNKKRNYTIAFIIGLAFPMALLFLIDFFNDKVIDRKDIERKTTVPIIGFISHNSLKSEIPVEEKPGSSITESFRAVRTALKYLVKENEKPVIAVTSTISAEGKTFISVNLAATIAMLGKKVLLVGLDMRKPRVNKVFEFGDKAGMSTYLSGNCSFEEIINKTTVENLYFAPAGSVPPNPAELMESELMKQFIERVKKEFDYIVIDTPPVAIVTDALLLAPFVDLNLFVVRQRYTSLNTLDIVDHLYKNSELKNLAIVINDIQQKGYYGYGMRYGYRHGYGYSYGYSYYGGEYNKSYRNSDKSSEYFSEE